MAYPISQGVTVQLGTDSSVDGVTQVTINETCPQVDTSDLSLASNSQRTFILGLKDAAEISMTHISAPIDTGNQVGGFSCGNISFSYATVMGSTVAYSVGEVVAYTTTIRASN